MVPHLHHIARQDNRFPWFPELSVNNMQKINNLIEREECWVAKLWPLKIWNEILCVNSEKKAETSVYIHTPLGIFQVYEAFVFETVQYLFWLWVSISSMVGIMLGSSITKTSPNKNYVLSKVWYR